MGNYFLDSSCTDEDRSCSNERVSGDQMFGCNTQNVIQSLHRINKWTFVHCTDKIAVAYFITIILKSRIRKGSLVVVKQVYATICPRRHANWRMLTPENDAQIIIDVL